MKQQPDELFRERLEQHSMAAPEMSWARIESNLARKNKPKLWLKIAATVSLFALALVWLLPIGGESEISVTDATITKSTQSAMKENISSNEKAQALQNKEKTTPLKKAVKNFKPSKKNYIPVRDYSKQENTVVIVPKEELINPLEKETLLLVEETTELNSPVVEAVGPEAVSTVVVYAAVEVNEKYLLKTTPVDATVSDEKTSSFRKLLNKAAGLKNNQDALGGLRQKKNEILVLNRNEKSEQNN